MVTKTPEQLWNERDLLNDVEALKDTLLEKGYTNQRKWKKAKLGKKRIKPFTRNKYVPAKRAKYIKSKNLQEPEITFGDSDSFGEVSN